MKRTKCTILSIFLICLLVPNLAMAVGMDGTYKLGINKKAAAKLFTRYKKNRAIKGNLSPSRANRDILGEQRSFYSYNFKIF